MSEVPLYANACALSPGRLETLKASVNTPLEASVNTTPEACVNIRMLLSLYFAVTCNPSRAVTLPNIGVPYYIGAPPRITYPCPRHTQLRSMMAYGKG